MATTSNIMSLAFAYLALSLTHIASGVDAGYSGRMSDQFMGLSHRAGSRFMAAVEAQKGEKCGGADGDVCSGTPAKGGVQILQCCKNHCRNVLSDRNNCGACGNTCGFGQLCCNGGCVAVAYDVSNCGECGAVCKPGLRCEYGSCGYA